MNSKETMYHFIPANFNKFDFTQLLEEESSHQDGKYVIWHSSSSDCKYEHKFNVGDICYFYYTNIPDGSKRILLRGVVIETDIDKSINEELMFDDENKIKGIKVGKIRIISLYDIQKYNHDNLIYKYNVSNFRNQQYLNSDKNKDRCESLINDLESENANGKLSTLKKYFDENITKCEFSKYDKNIKKHESFVMENGFIYCEGHHLIMKSMIGKVNIPQEIIDDLNNRFCLCPTCHRKIHHGKKNEKRIMIKTLYEARKEWYDAQLSTYMSKETILEWLYDMYDC